MAVYPDASIEESKKHLVAIVKHELRHHLENLAGVNDLEIEDALFVRRVLNKIRI